MPIGILAAIVVTSSAPAPVDLSTATTRPIHGIHLTATAAGSKKYRQKLETIFAETVINAVVVDMKEENGYVYVPGVKTAIRIGAYQPVAPDLAEWLAELRKKNIYTAARIVVFKDDIYGRKNPQAAVKNTHGEVWFDRTKCTWLDPYNPEAQTYNLLVALEAAKAGFDEIQFDYLRFPTDGYLGMMRFSKPFNRRTSSAALVEFLRKARQLLHPMGVKLSIDVFGLTTSMHTGMGIGQLLGPMAEEVDYVCPMTYPSHYNPGEYGLKNPNDEPYTTVSWAMRDAKSLLGADAVRKLRPYLQDFSLKGRGIRYGVKEVQAQIQAAADQGIHNWTLWNARCAYTLEAIQK